MNKSKKEKDGWELINLSDLLVMENRGAHDKLSDYSITYPLSALNSAKDKFVIIRDFATRKLEGKVDALIVSALYGGEHYPLPQSGMTIAETSAGEGSSWSVLLPNTLSYKNVELIDQTVVIYHSKGVKTTNLKEIRCLSTMEKISEDEISKRFDSLTENN